MIYAKCSCSNCGGHIEFERSHRGETTACPHCYKPTQLRPTGRTFTWFMGCILLTAALFTAALIAFAISSILRGTHSQKEISGQELLNDAIALQASFERDALKDISVTEFLFHNDSGIGKAILTITNGSPFPAMDIEVLVTFYGRSKTKLGTKRITLYEIFPTYKVTGSHLNLGFLDTQIALATAWPVSTKIAWHLQDKPKNQPELPIPEPSFNLQPTAP